MQPIIGITAPLIQGKITLDQDNINSVLMAGGISYIINFLPLLINLE
jgi:hypothetical protein